MKKPVQNDRHEKSAIKKYNKRVSNRATRRAAKKFGNEAPKKVQFRDYSG